MPKKKASEIKKGDSILIGEERIFVNLVEVSDIGKQGTKKCRIEGKKESGETVVLIRPAEYPIEVT